MPNRPPAVRDEAGPPGKEPQHRFEPRQADRGRTAVGGRSGDPGGPGPIRHPDPPRAGDLDAEPPGHRPPGGQGHDLAVALWESGIQEARILAALVEEPAAVTEDQMEEWAADFDSWDLVDQCCGGLFHRTELAYAKAVEWAGRQEEFEKRAGFSLMAQLAVHDKRAPDDRFLQFFPIIEREAADPRNFVKKAVNWALRGIGKRSLALNAEAVETALRIQAGGTGAARWVASDALRELRNQQVVARIRA